MGLEVIRNWFAQRLWLLEGTWLRDFPLHDFDRQGGAGLAAMSPSPQGHMTTDGGGCSPWPLQGAWLLLMGVRLNDQLVPMRARAGGHFVPCWHLYLWNMGDASEQKGGERQPGGVPSATLAQTCKFWGDQAHYRLLWAQLPPLLKCKAQLGPALQLGCGGRTLLSRRCANSHKLGGLSSREAHHHSVPEARSPRPRRQQGSSSHKRWERPRCGIRSAPLASGLPWLMSGILRLHIPFPLRVCVLM